MEMPDLSLKLSIVVPVYRSAEILPALVQKIENEMTSRELLADFELILVNDASPDHSWDVIQSLAATHNFIRGISLRKNTGQHNAIMAGLNHVRGKIIVVMDDDLQHPPSAIADLMLAVEDGYDVCYTKYSERQHAWWKQAGSRFNDYVATLLLDKPKGLYLSSFKAMRREIVEEVVKYDGPYTYIDGLILNATQSIVTREIKHQARYKGESNYNFFRLLSLWLKMATSFSVLPLRLATFLGFSLAAISLVMFIYVILAKYFHPEFPPGWTSLIAAILLIGGIQTFCIGVVGEYLGRAYLRLNRKQQFVVGRTTWK